METQTLNLYQKLLTLQEQVKGLGKDKQATTYKYVTGDKVLENLRPLWTAAGLLLKQEILSIDNERQDYIVGANTDKERTKSEILSKVMMKFTWVDCATGDKDENLFGANGQNDWDKGVGSALTYAERYFLLKYFHIATDEDDIDNPDRKPDDKAEAPKAASQPQATSNPAALTPPAPQADDLKWLNPKTQEWTDAIAYLQKDGETITKLRTRCKISKANEALLIDEAQKQFA